MGSCRWWQTDPHLIALYNFIFSLKTGFSNLDANHNHHGARTTMIQLVVLPSQRYRRQAVKTELQIVGWFSASEFNTLTFRFYWLYNRLCLVSVSIGGIMALFLGGSIISGVEFAYFFTIRLWGSYYLRRRQTTLEHSMLLWSQWGEDAFLHSFLMRNLHEIRIIKASSSAEISLFIDKLYPCNRKNIKWKVLFSNEINPHLHEMDRILLVFKLFQPIFSIIHDKTSYESLYSPVFSIPYEAKKVVKKRQHKNRNPTLKTL